ncbi:PucR family transcriptional regulator [Microbacterium sp. W4I20]|uniref:helix-turn-helix domain-containing protein n=1 Tax=Microbacterium sp. W4I20 TaxID=3042262 RepID=UPI0027844C66|nr:PucR family transcriptional regulator [Microbacterium sp. W4I20]MDQ0728296.1 DNA-binding PucR family transcriptional regulator [Microbacterium sp. W4I20]
MGERDSHLDLGGGQLTLRLGALGVHLLTAANGRRLTAAGVNLWDASSGSRAVQDAVVLAPGIQRVEEIARLVTQLAERGAAALVIRPTDIVPAHLLAEADETGLPVFSVDPDTDWLQVISLLTEMLRPSESEGAHSEPQRGDLFELADAIASTVGGATVIEDMHRQIVSYSTLPGQPIDEDRREGILGRQVPNVDENDEQYARLYLDLRAHRLAARAGALDRVAVAVMAGTEPLGSIWVIDADGTIDDDGIRILENSAKIAALRLVERRSSSDLSRLRAATLLQRALDGGDDARLVLDELGFTDGGAMVVVALRIEHPAAATPTRMARFVEFVANHAHSRERPAQVALIRDVVYMVAEVRGEEDMTAAALERLAGRIELWLQVSLFASCGPMVEAASQITKSRMDADVLLMLAPALDRRVLVAEEMRSHLALRDIASLVRPSDELRSLHATALLANDRVTGTEYASTVLTYLENHQDVIRAAGALFIHPNTLRYRLARIAELFGIDFDQADDTLLLWLTLRLHSFD